MIGQLQHLDATLFVLINSHHTKSLDVFFSIITNLGDGWIAIPLTAVIIVFATSRNYLATFLTCAAIIGALSGIATTQIKNATHRDRPLVYFEKHPTLASGSHTPVTVHAPGPQLRSRSFPSGHTATAFTIATLLAVAYGGLFFLTFIPAILVGYSRAYIGVHFPLDIAAGALLGIFFAATIITLFQKKGWLPDRRTLRRARA